tara:strand:+ start:1086 stop:2354 length:1269 start_codon:yes stop_codon:yes gene_type:complete
MNIAVIGSGGREHALCYKLKQSKKIKNLFCIPGNAGTKSIAKNLDIDILNFDILLDIIKKNQIDLVVVGPEKPLVLGIVDFLKKNNIKVFGPDKFASQLEGSKSFMKKICEKKNIPTAKFGIFNTKIQAESFIDASNTPIVVKADGLAAGKGVVICKSKDEAKKEVKTILEGKFESSKTVVIEEFLQGEELSYFVLTDGENFKFFGSAQDHKRVGEGDVGPNTGGMGAYSPSPLLTEEIENKIKNKIIKPTLVAMKEMGHPYEGILYAGLMIVKDEPFLIEYNIRMGDPECQALMIRLESDLLEIILSILEKKINNVTINWSKKKSITIVLCSKGYPLKHSNNKLIPNLNKINENENCILFHAGTYSKDGKIFSNGGRVLNATSKEDTLVLARNNSIKIIKDIDWKDGFYRNDIGWRAINKK